MVGVPLLGATTYLALDDAQTLLDPCRGYAAPDGLDGSPSQPCTAKDPGARRREQDARGRLAFTGVPPLVAIGLAAAGIWKGSPWSTLAGTFVAFVSAFLHVTSMLQPLLAFASAGFLLSARWMAPQRRATRIAALTLGAVALLLLVLLLSVGGPYCEGCYWWPWEPWRNYVVWVLPLGAILAIAGAPPWRPLAREAKRADPPPVPPR